MVAKSKFQEKKFFVIVFPEIRYLFLKNLKILLRANFNALLATVLRLTVTQKQETAKTIIFNF